MIMKDLITKYGEWIYRGVMVLGIAAILWLNQNYVTRSEFIAKMAALDSQNDSDNKANISAHLSLQSGISDIATTMKLMAATTAKTDDHEMRLRVVESRQVDVLSRLAIQERTMDKVQQEVTRKP